MLGPVAGASRRVRAPLAASGALVAAAVLAVLVVLLVGPGSDPGADPAADPLPTTPAAPAPAEVWVTTPDRTELLHQRASVAWRSDAATEPAVATITVDPGTSYQSMAGFGASLTDSSAHLIAAMPDDEREATMRRLFDPVDGLGISLLRQPIGSSDFTAAAEHYTYDDVPAGETDLALERFSVAHDEAEILPLLREALAINPELTVIATPWSPPAWMKTTGTLIGGQLRDDPAVYDAYARYLVRFVQEYAAAGVPVAMLTVQNEPQNRYPAGYPGTDLPAAQAAEVVSRLVPALRAAGLDTGVLGYDHNWALSPTDAGAADADYPAAMLDGPAGPLLAGTAFHCYAGDPSAMAAVHAAHPTTEVWLTECSGSRGADVSADDDFAGSLAWHARTLEIGATRSWSRSVVTWNLVLDERGGPHLGGCTTCTGLLTLADDGTVSMSPEAYALGHLSRFARPGAVRVASTSDGGSQLLDVAFTNPDGSNALMVHNPGDAESSFAIAVGDRHLDYTLPGGALATFVWPPG